MNENNSIEVPLLTYNSLYNLLREEKKVKKLQKLPELFYTALDNFFKNKKLELEKLKGDDSQKDKLKRERLIIINSKKISAELIENRCIKISNIAIKNKLFDEEVLSEDFILSEEKSFYDSVQKGLKFIPIKLDNGN